MKQLDFEIEILLTKYENYFIAFHHLTSYSDYVSIIKYEL